MRESKHGKQPTYDRQGRINHSGAAYQRKAGPFSFLVVVTFKRTLNVQTSKQRGKNLAADRRGPLAAGAPSHGTTGTTDNPALMTGLEQPLVRSSKMSRK